MSEIRSWTRLVVALLGGQTKPREVIATLHESEGDYEIGQRVGKGSVRVAHPQLRRA